MTKHNVTTKARELRVLLILSALMSFASISTGMYLPAFPEIGRALQASAAGVELTLSTFLIGFTVGQLFWGPISDRFGRKLPTAAGLGLFVFGSVGCALAGSLAEMMVWRVLQALGASAGPVLSRAMVRDMYGNDQAARKLSTLILIMAVAPLVGPLLGGGSSWQRGRGGPSFGFSPYLAGWPLHRSRHCRRASKKSGEHPARCFKR